MRNETLSDRQALYVRLGVGGVFGLGAGWLGKMLEAQHAMPDIWMHVALSVLLLGAFVLWAGAGTLRRLSLAGWGIVALSLIGYIAWNHVAAHTGGNDANPVFLDDHFLIYPFLFIAHELVSSADVAGRPVAPYSLYFDQASKRVIQLALAVAFTGLFWAILWLGATLLNFIGFKWLESLLQNLYFIGPAIGLALGSAVHLGDVQTKLLSNVRALALDVLSWLLPVIVVIGVIFTVSLGFSGLKPLWATKAATATLLAACVALAVLINAAYQQGDGERPVHIVLKWAVRVASGLLLIFAGLAAYSLHLRIDQYGLTMERVLAAVGVLFAMLFGLGYAYAAILPRGRWMQGLEVINITLAFVMVAVFFAILTPIADPARLSVDSQVARLESGKVTPDQFDWKMLRFTTGVYGTNALERLSKSESQAIRDAAVKAKAMTDEDRYDDSDAVAAITAKPTASQLHVVYPAGGTIPASFMAQDFTLNEGSLPTCMTPSSPDTPCNVAMIDLNHDGQAEVVLQTGNQIHVFSFITGVQKGAEPKWTEVATRYSIIGTDAVAAAFARGDIKATPAQWDDLTVGGESFKVDNDYRN